MSKAVQNWKIEVLFLAGLSARQVAREVLGDEDLVGRVHRLVRSKQLEALRQSDRRAPALLERERCEPDDLRGYVARTLTALAMEAGRKLVQEERFRSLDLARDRNRAELVARKALPSDLDRLRSVPVEPPKIIPVYRPKAELTVNAANCTLSWMGSQGWLSEWAVEAGVAYRRDFHLVGAGLKAMDYSKPLVDGGQQSGKSDGALDASARRERALSAVRFIFADDHLSTRLALLDHVAVQDLHLREFMGMPAHLARRRAAVLQETLEPIAWSYGLQRDGEVAKRLERWASGRAA